MRVAPNVRGFGAFCRHFLGHRRHRGRIQPPTHKNSDSVRAKTVGDSGFEERLEILDILLGFRIAYPPIRRRRPVASDLHSFWRDTQGMRGSQALNIAKARRGIVAIQPKQQEIPNRRFIQFVRYLRMHSNAIQRVAEQKEIPALDVIKWLDPEMIARAKQLFVARIPDGERKIAPQALHARRAPSGIGFENQFRVRSVWPDRPAGALQLGDEFRPAIESRVRGNPKPPVEARRLAFAERFARGPQHRVAQPDRTIHPALAGIWATEGEKIHQGLQKRLFERRTVPVVNADDTAQSSCLSIRVGALRMAKRSPLPSSWSTQTAFPYRPGKRPEAEFSVNENSFFYTLLGWFLLYWQLSPRSTAPCSADFIGTERGISRKD